MPEAEQEEARPGVTVVTSETMPAFIAGKLDKEPEVKAEPEKVEVKVEPEIKPDPEGEPKTEAEKKERKEGRLNKRFSEITGERDAERARAEAAEKRAAELEAKLNPPAPKAEDAEPKPEEFKDAFEYARALAKHAVDKALKEKDQTEAKKKAVAEREAFLKTFGERQDAFKAATPDYADVIESAADVKLTNEAQEAIWDSEYGPQLLYYFAQNPTEAERLGKLSVGGMWREMGKLEARFAKEPAKQESKSEPEKKVAPKVEISKAPSPISPLKGANAPADLPINSKGEWTGSYQQFKAAVEAGKIE